MVANGSREPHLPVVLSPTPLLPPLRLVLYEDNADLRASLSQLLGTAPSLALVAAFSSCEQAGADVRHLQPDAVLMDIDLPGCSGIEGLRLIKAATQKKRRATCGGVSWPGC